ELNNAHGGEHSKSTKLLEASRTRIVPSPAKKMPATTHTSATTVAAATENGPAHTDLGVVVVAEGSTAGVGVGSMPNSCCHVTRAAVLLRIAVIPPMMTPHNSWLPKIKRKPPIAQTAMVVAQPPRIRWRASNRRDARHMPSAMLNAVMNAIQERSPESRMPASPPFGLRAAK